MRKLPVTHLKRRGPELVVDLFAGGGGASLGIETALGRSPDAAINHDPEALAMHRANHPRTRHYATDVFDVDPRVITRDRSVGLLWASPDCTHHSKARGGKPIREAGKRSRSLAWVVVLWARRVRPRVIMLENVEEFAHWGPLDKEGKPCPARRGKTFRKWVRALQRLGYAVEWRELRACDYGSPTIRKRLFVVARCDAKPIRWPKPTHAKPADVAGNLKPWRTAAEIIDWSIPCPSIFLSTAEARAIGCKRPLKDSTLRRIARGLQRFVIDNPRPFIVPITHSGSDRTNSIDDPLRTITTAKRGEFSVVNPFMARCAHGDVGRRGSGAESLESPVPTLACSKDLAVISPFAVPRYGEADGQQPRCSSVEQPAPTIVPTGNGASLVSAFLDKYRANSIGQSAVDPLHTITACHSDYHPGGAAPFAAVAANLTHLRTSNTAGGNGAVDKPLNALTAAGNHVAAVMAFLQLYYGQGGQHGDCEKPIRTVPTKDRLGLVTVHGVDYQIVDIGMRMLSPRELFAAQGFPPTYRIDVEANGRRLPKSSQVRMCGNSVCPQLAAALVRANCSDLKAKPRRAGWRQLELIGV